MLEESSDTTVLLKQSYKFSFLHDAKYCGRFRTLQTKADRIENEYGPSSSLHRPPDNISRDKEIMQRFLVLLFVLLSAVVVARALRYVLTLQAYVNLAVISQESLTTKLACVQSVAGRQDAYEALRRHTELFGSCGGAAVDYSCWRRSVARDPLADLYFLARWCR